MPKIRGSWCEENKAVLRNYNRYFSFDIKDVDYCNEKLNSLEKMALQFNGSETF